MPLLHPYYAAYALLVLGLLVLFTVVFFGFGAWRGFGAGLVATALAADGTTAVVWYVVLPAMPDPPADKGAPVETTTAVHAANEDGKD